MVSELEGGDNEPHDESELTKSQKKLLEKRKAILARIQKLPDLKALVRNPVSEEVSNHFINILYGSCFVLRVFNGDLLTNAEESLGLLISVSKCLEREIRCSFGSIENAVFEAVESSIAIERENAKMFTEIIFADLSQVLKNKFFAFEILFKIYDLSHHVDESLEENERKKVGKIKQKLIFFMSFLKSEVALNTLEKWRIQVHFFC